MPISSEFVSVKRVLERVQSDFDERIQFNIADVNEWIGDFIDEVEIPQMRPRRVTDGSDHDVVNLSDYKVELPCDVYEVEAVRTYCNKVPLVFTTNLYITSCNKPITITTDCQKECPTKATDATTGNELNTTTGACNPFYNSNPSPYVDPQAIGNGTWTGGDGVPKYTLNQGWLWSNIKTGSLEIAFKSTPKDANGYPMLPRETWILQAARWYITMKLATKLWYSDRIQDKKFQYIDRECQWAMQHAYGRAGEITKDEAEAIKYITHRPIPSGAYHEGII